MERSRSTSGRMLQPRCLPRPLHCSAVQNRKKLLKPLGVSFGKHCSLVYNQTCMTQVRRVNGKRKRTCVVKPPSPTKCADVRRYVSQVHSVSFKKTCESLGCRFVRRQKRWTCQTIFTGSPTTSSPTNSPSTRPSSSPSSSPSNSPTRGDCDVSFITSGAKRKRWCNRKVGCVWSTDVRRCQPNN